MTKSNAVESRGTDLRDIKLRPAYARLPSSPGTALPVERGNAAADHALRRRIRSEFEEMPGLSLTLIQGVRLFGVSTDIVARIFRGLVEEGVLRRTPDGRYALDREHP